MSRPRSTRILAAPGAAPYRVAAGAAGSSSWRRAVTALALLVSTAGFVTGLFAGADPAAPADGLVVVQVDDAGGGTPVWPSSTVRLPGAGAVKLQSVLGSQVTLLDAHGLVHVLSLLNDAAN